MNRFMGTLLVLVLSAVAALAQTQTTGQISGTVSDISGAVLPQTKITVTGKDTGLIRTTETNATGYYQIPLLQPGNYMVSVTVKGFQTVVRDGITVPVGGAVLVDFRLAPGSINEKVTVTAQAPLIEPNNPNTTTTFEARQLADLPNPGMDLSYVASLAPGALLNTVSNQGLSNGNFEVSGLPSVANDFTIDGLDANDPFVNTNSTGSSGLQLGLNAIQEASVSTQAYSVDEGRFGGAVVNYVTKSGGNAYHGNVYELWNGSALNSRNFFLNANGVQQKPRTNTNLFGASIGGPIKKDRLFFFADFEAARLVVANILRNVLPTPSYQNYVLQQLPLGGTDPVFGTVLPPQPEEVPFYQRMFALMGDTSRGTSFGPVPGCPFDVGGVTPPAIPGAGDGCANVRLFSAAPVNSETLFTVKLDYYRTPKDSYWFRFQLNNGTSRRPDPVSLIFDRVTPTELRSGSAGWTHVFSSDLVNQFNPGLSYRSAIGDLQDPSKALAAMPITYSLPFPFSTVGGALTLGRGGSATTTWQLNDNLAWTRGRHSLKFGVNMRRPLLTDFHSIFVVPEVFGISLGEFTFGAAGGSIQSFPKSTEDRIAAVNMDLYAMDTLKATRRLTMTYGLRAVWNSNPVSRQQDFSRLTDAFEKISHDVNRPPNQDILAGQEKLYASTPLLQWQPRAALAYQVSSNTLLTAGFGLFGDPLSLLSGFNQAENPPSKPVFQGGLFGQVGGLAVFPGVPNSVEDAAVAANQQFQSAFPSGALSCASPQASSNCVPVLTLSADYSGPQRYPYIMQWGSSLQHQLGNSFGIVMRYVGTRSVRTFYATQPNLFQTACQGCFAPIPFNTPLDARFASVNSFHAGANSTYHALVATGEKRMSHGLAFQINYTYSHCIDFTSNGGQLGFNDNFSPVVPPSGIRGLRGSCDYDVRHSMNASYIYELPFNSRRPWVAQIVHGWQLAGTVFVRGGFPFSVFSTDTQFVNFQNGSPVLFANVVPGQSLYSRLTAPGTQPGTIQWLNPNAFQGVIDPNTFGCFPANESQFCKAGTLGRNALRGPGFRWMNLSITKRFKMNEKVSLRVDTQFFNVFNHPNFAIPSSLVAGIPGDLSTLAGFGAISSSVSPVTGLLGSGLGGDTSIRMIALGARIEF